MRRKSGDLFTCIATGRFLPDAPRSQLERSVPCDTYMLTSRPWRSARPSTRTCAICLDERICVPLPCCGRRDSTLQCCSTCLHGVCGRAGEGRCPACRARLALVDGSVALVLGRGCCSLCSAEDVAIVQQTADGKSGCVACTRQPAAWPVLRRLRVRVLACLQALALVPLEVACIVVSGAVDVMSGVDGRMFG